MASKRKKSRQLIINDIIDDEEKKRKCDCWLNVGKCYCAVSSKND